MKSNYGNFQDKGYNLPEEYEPEDGAEAHAERLIASATRL